MGGVNRVILVGHLGKDPEVRYTPNGQAVANFTIATSDTWTDKGGQKQERTEWHRIVAWAKLAELCGEYLAKGRQVYVEGRIQTRQWEDRDGQKRYTTEILASQIVFLGGRGEGMGGGSSGGGSSGGGGGGSSGGGNRRQPQSDHQGGGGSGGYDDFSGPPPLSDDDVPF